MQSAQCSAITPCCLFTFPHAECAAYEMNQQDGWGHSVLGTTTSERSRSKQKRDKAMIKLIGIEEHFVTAEISAAWAASAIGEEGTGAFDRGEVGEGSIIRQSNDWH